MQTATVYSDISFRLQGTVGILSLIHILLLHKQEIRKIQSTLMEKGLTLIPLKLYFKDSLVKMELGVARGKKLYDKRASEGERDAKRAADRAIKERTRA